MLPLTIGVIIPTKDRPALLIECVQAVLDEADEVLVVFDSEDDPSFPMVTALSASHNLSAIVTNNGRGGARQAGLEAATSDVVLFLDDDVIAEPQLVQGHRDAHAITERVVVGYMPVLRPTSVFSRLYATEYENSCTRYESEPDAVLNGLWGGNVSLRRSDALKVGMVSDGFSHRYHEDTDFGLRCVAAGLNGHFDRSLRSEHRHTRSLAAFLRDGRSQGEGRALLRLRHGTQSPFPPPSGRLVGLCAHTKTVKALTLLLAPLAEYQPVARLLRRLQRLNGEVTFGADW